jgi:predicted nucleic acid-binding protein
MKLVVDANIFISALIGGKAAELLFNPDFDLLTTERTTWEVKKYLPQLAEYTEDTSKHLLYLFNGF